MKSKSGEGKIEKEVDKVIQDIILPITKELYDKARDIKLKRLDIQKEIYDISQQKQSLINKKNKISKQRIIYENKMNADFSNIKTCKDCLINYINLIEKKETDFLRDKDDYYDLKLRRKKLEFNYLLLDLIKEKSKFDKKLNPKRKLSFDNSDNLNNSCRSVPKKLNKTDISISFKKRNKNKTITPDRKKSKRKIEMKKINNESNESTNKDIPISKEIEKLINNYSSKKNGIKNGNTVSSENFNEGLAQLKKINKDTKSLENDLKEIMNDIEKD